MLYRGSSSGEAGRSRAVWPVLCMVLLFAAAPALAGCLEQLSGGKGAPGGWALDFLQDDEYSTLLVEIDYESGAAPDDQTINMLRDTLENRLNKPDGIEIRTSAEADGKGRGGKYSFAEIRDLENEHRDHQKGGDRAVIYVMFLNGGSSQDSSSGRVLGAVYSGSSMVIFKDNLRYTHEECNKQLLAFNCPSFARIENAVVTHELGHVLGLVNLNPADVPMVHDREDPESESHSKYKDSVMYRAIDTSASLIDFLSDRSLPTEYDHYDVEDLRNAGGK